MIYYRARTFRAYACSRIPVHRTCALPSSPHLCESTEETNGADCGEQKSPGSVGCGNRRFTVGLCGLAFPGE